MRRNHPVAGAGGKRPCGRAGGGSAASATAASAGVSTDMNGLAIGSAARQLGVKADTLRYYDRIGLVRPAARGPAGRRIYLEDDLVKLRFVQRAQAMNYRLKEISVLLKLREQPGRARAEARRVTAQKLAEVQSRLATLTQLGNELQLMLTLCDGREGRCPILDTMEGGGVRIQRPRRGNGAGKR